MEDGDRPDDVAADAAQPTGLWPDSDDDKTTAAAALGHADSAPDAEALAYSRALDEDDDESDAAPSSFARSALPALLVLVTSVAFVVTAVIFLIQQRHAPAPAISTQPAIPAAASPAASTPASTPPALAPPQETIQTPETPQLLPYTQVPLKGTPDNEGVGPINLRNPNGICNYMTTHTENASGGIERLVLWGFDQGFSIEQTQARIQEAVTQVCPWNQASFAKHVMTSTADF